MNDPPLMHHLQHCQQLIDQRRRPRWRHRQADDVGQRAQRLTEHVLHYQKQLTSVFAEIVEAIEGPIAMTACVDHDRQDCALEKGCSVRPHWQVINTTVRDALAGVPLTRLVETRA